MAVKKIDTIKRQEKLATAGGAISGAVSFAGGYQICHSICLGIVALLSIIGITVVGMPLLFLTKVAIPFWIAGMVLLLISILLYVKKKCISKNMIMLNSGILVAAVPFQQLERYLAVFWIIGGIVAALSIFSFIKDRRKMEGHEKAQCCTDKRGSHGLE